MRSRTPDGERPQVMHQRWESLLFLHWQLEPARVQETLPDGITVDTINGAALLAVVPFFMRNVRPVGLPAVGWLSHFLELNVRTYVYDRAGTPGIWFYSLDCNQPVAVALARRTTGLPYFNAKMKATAGEFIEYTSQRRGSADLARFSYRGVGEAREPDHGSFEFFVLERYYFFAIRGRSLIRAQVSHSPYRPRAAEVAACSAIPAQIDGFPELNGAPMHACYVDGFDVKIYGTQKLA
jgi:uncharacterized protein YqjF (DUF2071 family)